ncbi:MAG: SPASM domain-containing protein [Methylovirgula sp.]
MASLEITTKLGCSLACTFCPQGALVKHYPKESGRLLARADLARVVEKLPAHVRIDFSGMSEPWLNPETTAMVIDAFERGRQVAIYTTLQGMPAEDADYLLTRFGDQITPASPWLIHLPDADGNMPGWKMSDAYVATLQRFVHFKADHPRSVLKFMTMSGDGRIAPELDAILPKRLRPFKSISRAENLRRSDFSNGEIAEKVAHETAVLCRSTPFFDHNCLLPNGDVVLCCMDYSMESVIGNLFESRYEDLFTSPAMNEVRRRAMTPGADPDFICKRCDNAAALALTSSRGWKLEQAAYWADALGTKRRWLPRFLSRRRADGEIV